VTDASRFPLETPCRLSRSVLWRLQRRYFERRGIAAWADGDVPHRVTSSPRLARAYAAVIAGFLHDWSGALDRAQPVYLVELGAGAGRFAFHLRRALEELDELLGDPPQLCYVMTDIAEANLAAWRAHPQLEDWLADGRLDLARFDAACDAAIDLEHSGAVLAPGTVRNPVVVIANYVFDSLPLDVFSIVDGRLHEWLVRLSSRLPDGDLDDPEVLGRATLGCELAAASVDGYYGDAELEAILDEQRTALPGTSFTIPSASLACLGRLAAIAGDRMLVLTADKGDVSYDALRGQTGPHITLHGSCSVAVNFHAIRRFVERRGGQALLPSAPPRHLAGCGFVLGNPAGGLRSTTVAFEETLDTVRPDDLLAMPRIMDHVAATQSLDAWLAHLAFHAHDPAVVFDALPHLAPLAARAGEAERLPLIAALCEAWDRYFHIGEPFDVSFELGKLAAALGAWPMALEFFEGSLRWYGRTDVTLAELARCHAELDRLG
jgi:putative S-adenosyl-L-methionine-dependent methyltransferase